MNAVIALSWLLRTLSNKNDPAFHETPLRELKAHIPGQSGAAMPEFWTGTFRLLESISYLMSLTQFAFKKCIPVHTTLFVLFPASTGTY